MFIVHKMSNFWVILLRLKEEHKLAENDLRPAQSAQYKKRMTIIEKIGKFTFENCYLNVRALAKISGSNKESVYQILHE